jgi:hypothetical protein
MHKFKRHEEILSSLLFSSLLFSSVMIFAQICTNPSIALVQTGSECNSYELRMFNPPTDPLVFIGVTVGIVESGGSNDIDVNAALGSELSAAGGYNVEVTSTNSVRLQRFSNNPSTHFQLPSFSGTALTLFSFTFVGDVDDIVTATIDPFANIIIDDIPVDMFCPPSILNGPVSCTFSGGSMLSGTITAIQNCLGSVNGSLEGATVAITSTSAPGLPYYSTLTDQLGYFEDEVLAGEDYLISPEYDLSEPDCGLDDADIVKIAGEIMGTLPFTDPWEFVAADFNLSNTITNLDQIGIRRAILDDVYPAGFKSWRMVNAAALSGGLLNGFNLSVITETETVMNAPLSGAPNLNFIGVKTGDVQVSCTQCVTTNSSLNSVPLAGLKAKVTGSLSEGGIIELRLSSEEAYKELWLIGLEFILSPEHLEVLEVRGEGGFKLQEEGYAVNAQTGRFHGIWLPLEQQFLELGKGDQLIVKAKVKQPFSKLSEVFTLLDGANLYPKGKKHRLSIVEKTSPGIVAFPNPFGDQLYIKGLQELGQLSVFDAAGRLVHQQFVQPLVENNIATHNWQPGLYFYRIESAIDQTSGKLIKQ